MPETGYLALGLVLLVAGAAVGTVGVLGWLERLPRNQFVGMRTNLSLRDDRSFRIANKAAGPPTTAAGAVAALGGVLGAVIASLVPILIGVFGMIGLTVAGAILGNRAVRAASAEEPS